MSKNRPLPSLVLKSLWCFNHRIEYSRHWCNRKPCIYFRCYKNILCGSKFPVSWKIFGCFGCIRFKEIYYWIYWITTRKECWIYFGAMLLQEPVMLHLDTSLFYVFRILKLGLFLIYFRLWIVLIGWNYELGINYFLWLIRVIFKQQPYNCKFRPLFCWLQYFF